MSESSPLDRLDPALTASTRWLRDIAAPFMLIGGVATGLLSQVRATKDVDWLASIPEDKLAFALAAAEKYGIVSKVSGILDFVQTSCVFPLVHQPSGGRVDVALAGSSFEEDAIRNAHPYFYKGLSVPLPRPEDLVVMKAIANRPQDHADIANIIRFNSGLDLRYVRRWVNEFADLMENLDIAEALEHTLKPRSMKMNIKKKPVKKK